MVGHLINLPCGLGAHARHGESGGIKKLRGLVGFFYSANSETAVGGVDELRRDTGDVES